MANEETTGKAASLDGLSTDTKPTTNVPVGSIYQELDTGNYWKYSANINPTTSNGWWPL